MGKFGDGIKDGAKNVKNFFGEIFTGIIVLALIIYSFVGIGLNDTIDETFWIVFAVNFSLMILVTSIWYPSAKQKAQFQDEGYLIQRKKYGELVDKVVNTNNQRNLSKFCDWATEQNKIFKIKQKLIKINVDYDIFVKYSKELDKLDNDKILTDEQKKKLRVLIENGVSVKKISYSRIITGIKASSLQYDTTSSEQKYDFVKLASKIFISVCTSIFMGFIVFKLYGFTWESVAQLFMWLIVIAWNIFTSYNAGYKSISVKRAEYYKKLKTFLEEFVSSEYFNMKDKDERVEIAEAIINE